MGMCIDCVTKATTVVAGVLPGWDLLRARDSFEHWIAGSWILSTEDGSAAITWCGDLVPEPGQVCIFGDTSEDAYLNTVNAFETAALVDPRTGWRLVQSAVGCGYDPEVDELGSWLINFLAQAIAI